MYPDGYGTREITLEQMRARHEPHMHPEFARRFFAYIESQGGFMGVGGGYRPPGEQPDGKPGFAPPGKSFHEGQVWASGLVAYAAVDLVVRQPGRKHRSPTWAETDGAPVFGLHTFINNEPWHVQCVEQRGWQTWVNAGRPDPPRFTLPGDHIPQPPPTSEEVDMFRIRYRDSSYAPKAYTGLICNGPQIGWIGDGNADLAFGKGGVRIVEDLTAPELDGMIRTLQTTTVCPPEWRGTPRGAQWDSNRG